MIQPTGRAVLRELGLEDALIAGGARVDRLVGLNDRGRTVLDVRYAELDPMAFGVGVHRATLFDLLHRAVAAAGIAIEGGRTITGRAAGRLEFEGGASAGPFDLIVDALGSRSSLAPSIGRDLAYGALWASLDWCEGFDAHALEQRYRAARKMVGILPSGTPPGAERYQAAFFWSLRAERLDAWRTAGLDAWKDEVRALWPATAPLLDQVADAGQLTFARYAHRTLAQPVEGGLIHLGDAWHSTSPQLGQGVNMALLDAWALAFALRERAQLTEALALAASLRGEHVRLYQAMSRLFTPVYQSDGAILPWARDVLVPRLARTWPAPRVMAAMVAGIVGGPMRPMGLD